MNKRAVIEDWADVMFTVTVVAVVVFIFGVFVNADKLQIESAIKDADLRLEQETALMNYLRMPIADFTKKEVPSQLREIYDYSIKNKLIVADLFTLITIDAKYAQLIGELTSNDDVFSKYKINTDLSNIEQGVLSLSHKQCTGKTSTAYLPIKNKKPISVILAICK